MLDEQLHVSSDSYINNGKDYTGKKHEQDRRSHEKSQERQEYLIRNSRESGLNVRKHTHRHSHFRESSESSPYKPDLSRKYAQL